MPHVNVNYKMYLPGGHHRQPRNIAVEVSLIPQGAGADVTNPGAYTPPFFPQLPYNLGGANTGMSKLLFWNVTDGTTGQVLKPAAFTQQVGQYPLNITGWYWPISGPSWPGPGSGIIDDAFSASLGQFIDDTFVNVTSNPALTNDANVSGSVPTTNAAVTLEAYATVASTTEPFRQWILNDGIMPIGNRTLNVPKGTDGIAIAVYQAGDKVVTRVKDPHAYEVGPALILGGVRVDGGGIAIIGGVPHPVDPWGPIMEQLARSANVATQAKSMSKEAGAGALKAAAQDAIATIKAAMPELEKQAK